MGRTAAVAGLVGATNRQVADELGVTPQLVGRWRARFTAGRLAALADLPRPGGPRTITNAQVEAGSHRADLSTRALAAELGVSQSTASRIRRGLRSTSDH
ncbi:helix-turn-helix domain-containing protein [Cryptosporangium sp. NPDC051539]|uniref:helix-turn-helix domain-containing protein n=1 Tax=Cryptosporangium sp. NPDC051539 TaxID=3363962 RepID=UPI00378F4751